MSHQYTVATHRGDVDLTTPNHHSAYETLQEFLRDHKDEIAAALGVSAVSLQILGLYLSHGRGGKKLL